LKQVSLIGTGAVIVFFVLAIANPSAITSQDSVPQAAAQGKRVFNQYCAACHDTLGTIAKSGPGLKNYYRRRPYPTDTSLRTIIQQGRGKMPAFSTLNKSQVEQLIAYLKTLT
jgi:mono/diheme cytochrome c family protein